MGTFFDEQIAPKALVAAEVPQILVPQLSNVTYKPAKSSTPYKKPRIEVSVEDEYFIRKSEMHTLSFSFLVSCIRLLR